MRERASENWGGGARGRGIVFEVWSGQLLCALITRGKGGVGKGKREGEIEKRGGTPGERRKGEEEPERGRRSNCPASLRHCLASERGRRASWGERGSSEGRTGASQTALEALLAHLPLCLPPPLLFLSLFPTLSL